MENSTTTQPTTLGNIATKAPQSPLLSSFERSANLHTELHGALDALEQRLADLLTPMPEDGEKAGVNDRESTSTMTNLVEAINDKTAYAIRRISSLLDKLEV